MRLLLLAAALALPVGVGGCLTHLPPGKNNLYREVAWEPDLTAAKARAAQRERPILLCMAAGDLHDLC